MLFLFDGNNTINIESATNKMFYILLIEKNTRNFMERQWNVIFKNKYFLVVGQIYIKEKLNI